MSFRMYHPDVESTAECPSEEAFQQAWEHLGWLKLDDSAVYASDILGHPVKDVDDLKVEDLKRLIRYRGHELPSGRSKDEHLATYKSLFTDNPKTEALPVVETPTPGFIPGVNDPNRSPVDVPDTSGLPSDPQHLNPEGNV